MRAVGDRRWLAASVALALLAVALVAWLVWPLAPGSSNPPPPGPGVHTATDDGRGSVTFKATHDASKDPDGSTAFVVVLDTHSVPIGDYDVKSLVLVEDSGMMRTRPLPESQVLKADAHHVEALLVFPVKPAGKLGLVALDLGGVPERRLVFQL